MNNKFIQSKVENISEELIENVIKTAKGEGHTSHALLGCSGESFILFGESRRREISLRMHSGDVKLLVTDNIGGFLFYGGYDLSLLPIKFIAKEYFKIIQNLKYLLDNTSPDVILTEQDKEKMNKSNLILQHLFNTGY